jgi:hypothetical protein
MLGWLEKIFDESIGGFSDFLGGEYFMFLEEEVGNKHPFLK